MNITGVEIFRTRSDSPWGPPSPLYKKYVASFLWLKWPGSGADHPPSPSAGVKQRAQLAATSTHHLDLPRLFWVSFIFTFLLLHLANLNISLSSSLSYLLNIWRFCRRMGYVAVQSGSRVRRSGGSNCLQ
jgi:hypothetical protein